MTQAGKTLHDLGLEIADCGRSEEFHQKRREYEMYDHFKDRRLKLQREYNEMKATLAR